MNIYDNLITLKTKYKNYFWEISNDSHNAIQLGTIDNSHLVFEYNETHDSYYIRRTIFREYNSSSTLSNFSFEITHREYMLIKNLMYLVTEELKNKEEECSEIKLMNTVAFINNHFNS